MGQTTKRVGSLKVSDLVLSAYNYELPKSTVSALGGVQLFDNSELSILSTNNDYGVQLSGNKAYVHVPTQEQKTYTFTSGLSCVNDSVSVVLSDLVIQNEYIKVVNNKLSADDNTKVTYVIWR